MKEKDNELFLALKGALIGTGAILPGISGGVLCVAMGIYQPMMALLAHPLRMLKTRFWFYLPLLCGFIIGVLGLSRLVDWLFRASPEPAVWLFIGLIGGTLPELFRESGREGRPTSAWVTGGIAFAVMLAALLVLRSFQGGQVTPTFGTWLLCGVLWGIGLMAPGLSPSSLFLFMGVYQPMAAGIAAFDLSVLLPMGLGLVACVLLLSRGMTALLGHAYPQTMHALLGFSVASTVIILPVGSICSWQDGLIDALCFALGLGLALWMSRVSGRMQREGQKA